ncbi:MAG: LptA/OstA family protein [Candidatus Wallbacteria bacterium]|nr:LptA/OstA family protein [Candidatus Wallbacteria bacterium]
MKIPFMFLCILTSFLLLAEVPDSGEVTVYGDIMEGYPDGVRVVKGNLKAVQGKQILTGDWGKYYEQTQIVEAYGQVKLDDPGYTLTCGMIMSFFSEKRGVAKQNPVVIEKVPLAEGTGEISMVPIREKYMRLTAREITSYYEEDRMVANDNVIVEEHFFSNFQKPGKPEISSTLNCQSLEMFLKENKSIARGNVMMKSEDITAYGDEAVYYNDEDKLILTGNAKALQQIPGSGKQNQVSGEKIIYFMKDGRTVVLKGRADVYPGNDAGSNPNPGTNPSQNPSLSPSSSPSLSPNPSLSPSQSISPGPDTSPRPGTSQNQGTSSSPGVSIAKPFDK